MSFSLKMASLCFQEYELESLKQIDWSLISYKVLQNVNISIVLKAEVVLGEILTQKQVVCQELRAFHTFPLLQEAADDTWVQTAKKFK